MRYKKIRSLCIYCKKDHKTLSIGVHDIFRVHHLNRQQVRGHLRNEEWSLLEPGSQPQGVREPNPVSTAARAQKTGCVPTGCASLPSVLSCDTSIPTVHCFWTRTACRPGPCEGWLMCLSPPTSKTYSGQDTNTDSGKPTRWDLESEDGVQV